MSVGTVTVRHFARLKLRVIANGLRGQSWRVAMFVFGCLFGLFAAFVGFLLFAAPALAGDNPDRFDIALAVAGLGGGAIVLGWLMLPLVFFGVDETLDPARFALLPLPRRGMVAGLVVAGLVGVPTVATAAATAGTVWSAAALGGFGAAAVQVLGVLLGLLLCVAGSRALTSSFAAMLRTRRMRDLAAILLTLLVALLTPIQIAAANAISSTDPEALYSAARVVQWTPFGAPYTAGMDVAAGRPLAAVVKLAGTVLLIAAVLWIWSRSLESAMAGTGSGGQQRPRTARGGAVGQLFPWGVGWLPRSRFGALVARGVRYWWRDTRRRASVVTIGVVGVFMPVFVNLRDPDVRAWGADGAPLLVTVSMLVVGAMASLSVLNEFGYDGSAYAANVAAGIRGRVEVAARVVAFSLYMVPLMVLVAVVLAAALGSLDALPLMLGALAAAYGVGLAVNLPVSVVGAYALPETSNPFAVNTGSGAAKNMLGFVSLFGVLVASSPLLLGAALLDRTWAVIALPIGLVYGVGATLLGCYIAGDLLDRRAPEVLQAVTPRR